MTDAGTQRYLDGLWVATTKAFPARYGAKCASCGHVVEVGHDMVGVFRKGVPLNRKLYMHEGCRQQLGVPAFIGKNG